MSQVPPVPPSQPPVPPSPSAKGASGLAIAALVLGILGILPILGLLLGLIGIVLGAIALATNRPGRGLAVGGIAAGAVGIIAVQALIVSILLPSLSHAKELAKQAMCRANLAGIGGGWAMYQSENLDSPPILPDVLVTDLGSAGNYMDDLRMGATCTAADLGEGAQQNLCLLVEIGTVSWKMFLCPSVGRQLADRSRTDRRYGLGEVIGGGARKSYIDYGIQIPYQNSTAPGDSGPNACPLEITTDPGVVILADRAPEGDLRRRWSPNHPDDGESVLYFGGNVKFTKAQLDDGTRNVAGWGRNNIYTRDQWKDDDPADGVPELSGYGTENKMPLKDVNARVVLGRYDTVLYAWK